MRVQKRLISYRALLAILTVLILTGSARPTGRVMAP